MPDSHCSTIATASPPARRASPRRFFSQFTATEGNLADTPSPIVPMPILRYSRTFLLFSLVSLVSTSPVKADDEAPADDPLRSELEGIYAEWKQAVTDRDAAHWEKVTAAYTRMNIRNTIVSQKLAFPDALFESPVRPPALEGLKFLDARAVKRTAQAIYFGRINFGLEPAMEPGTAPTAIPENLLVLRFIREDTWKFDTTRLLSLEGADEVKKQIADGDYSFLEDETFTPPGEVPAVPRPCAVPERIGHLQVVALGYETEITINNGSKHLIADTASAELIIGGLKSGPNRIVIRTRPIPSIAGEEEIEKEFQLRILSLDDHAQKEPIEVFKYTPTTVPPLYEAHVRGLPN